MRWLPSRFRLLGQVDHVNDRIVRGWAWQPKEPNRRIDLDVFYDTIYLGTTTTGLFRRDLAAHGIGDGHHAFVFHVPDDVPEVDAARLRVATSGPTRRRLPLSKTLAPDGAQGRKLPDDYRRTLGPYVASLRCMAAHTSPDATESAARPHIDTICAAAIGRDTSAFVEHIGHKYGRRELADEDPADLWRWYLGTYAMERGRRLAPLSREDLAHLNTARGGTATYASSLFARPGDTGDDPFRWAREARRFFAAECLVTEAMIARLRARADPDSSAAYPLSMFMERARRETVILRRLPITTEADRCKLYALFLVLALRDPPTLAYLPQDALHRLLDDGDDLDTALTELFGPQQVLTRGAYLDLLASSGGTWPLPNTTSHRYDGHRVLNRPAVVTSATPVDVQIFGPFSRKMGLGESCRRVARALDAASVSLNLVDYDIGNASARIDAAKANESPRAARLNILHLNLEEIPEAFAYLPDVFARAPVVAIPYWELNKPASAHHLGLRTVDELWVASRFLEDVFAKGGTPVRWIGMSFDDAPAPTAGDLRELRARYGVAPESFCFLTTSDALSWIQRKNPLGVIEAFQSAFQSGEGVALMIKTHNLNGPLSATQIRHWTEVRARCAADPRLTLIDDSVDAKTQRTLRAASDCLVSLHRAEGLGLDLIDALAFGTPVVTTAYSGPMDLCTPETAWLVDATLRPVDPSDYSFVEPGHVWAEPSMDAAVAALRGVYCDARLRTRRIDVGRRSAQTQASPASFAERIADEVHRLLRRPAVT